MGDAKTLSRLATGITDLLKRLETLEQSIGRLCDCVNDLTVCIEAAPMYEDAELAEGEAEYLDGYPADPAKTH